MIWASVGSTGRPGGARVPGALPARPLLSRLWPVFPAVPGRRVAGARSPAPSPRSRQLPGPARCCRPLPLLRSAPLCRGMEKPLCKGPREAQGWMLGGFPADAIPGGRGAVSVSSQPPLPDLTPLISTDPSLMRCEAIDTPAALQVAAGRQGMVFNPSVPRCGSQMPLGLRGSCSGPSGHLLPGDRWVAPE